MVLTPPLLVPKSLLVHTSARGPAGYYDLRREARDWLVENGIIYAFRMNPNSWAPVIFFEKPEHAFAFKMRWF
jgi:hypothetical protein